MTAIAYLSTRVTVANRGDLKKLKRLLGFLSGTIDDVLTLSADSLDDLREWIDTSHGTDRRDRKGQVGMYMTFGTGTVYVSSKNHNCNHRSPTETETVGLASKVPCVLWLRQFVQAQVYSQTGPTTVYQDNTGSISMMNRVSPTAHGHVS